jgi:formylglycine-generating enzyme required for sulfatase activity
MKKMRVFSVILAFLTLIAMGLVFTAAKCSQDRGSGSAGGSGRSGNASYEMIRVPGGSFQMGDTVGDGDSDERPVHTVTLSAFSIGKYEVTQGLYESVMGYNPSYFNGYTNSSNRPVEQVTWFDAAEFCNKLSVKERLQPVYAINGRTPAEGYPITSATVIADWSKNGYRLPTEAQWEYAAKGGNGSPGNYTYAGSDNRFEVAWFEGNGEAYTRSVGTKKPNGLGIYDMSGNVWEWCWDLYGSYSNEAQTDPAGASSGSFRMSRGGSWFYSAEYARSAYRYYFTPSDRNYFLGFRLVLP